ncbi:hypothetical protein COCNU_11G003010 [Cocos nucifera]|uniref:Uncharacterized protein n=1 Tax=Cocos nucifera TaxID=13894 RepID=A0A8K0INK5_COCNU|nr:hypothetical protein COCNU_11G003010 [Cocos nucifera]
MGFRLGLGSKAKRFFIPSPAKEKPLNGQSSVGGFDFEGKVVDSGVGLRSPEFVKNQHENITERNGDNWRIEFLDPQVEMSTIIHCMVVHLRDDMPFWVILSDFLPKKGIKVSLKIAALKGTDFERSKDEIFFDSRAWLDSDCEDDFYSVNGEFTPSRGSTPNHQTSTVATPRLNNAFFVDKFPDSKSEPSPIGRRKLADLLQETSNSEKDEQNASEKKLEMNGKPDDYKINFHQPPKSLDGTPYSGVNSVYNNEVTPNRDSKNRKERTWRNAHCCFPSLVQSFGFDERQKMSPGPCTA